MKSTTFDKPSTDELSLCANRKNVEYVGTVFGHQPINFSACDIKPKLHYTDLLWICCTTNKWTADL